jgi:hypothetical protein
MSRCLSICRESTASTGWIVVKFDTVLSNQKPVKKKFGSSHTKITGTLHTDLHKCMTVFVELFFG